jgi:hypothetical protein
MAVSVTINALPAINTTGIIAAVCENTTAQTATLPYSSTTNNPTSYSIDWATIADQGATAFAFAVGGGNLTTIAIPAGTLPGNILAL